MFLFRKFSNEATEPHVVCCAEHVQEHAPNEPLGHLQDTIDCTGGKDTKKTQRRSRKSEPKDPLQETRREVPETTASKTPRRSRDRISKSKEPTRRTADASYETLDGTFSKTEEIAQEHKADHPSNETCALCNKLPPTVVRPETTRPAIRLGSSDSESEFGCITLSGRRKIQFCGFSNTLASRVGNELGKVSPSGKAREKALGSDYQVKLHGYPWRRPGGIWGTAVASKDGLDTILRHMFILMTQEGYRLLLSTQGTSGTGTFYFKKSPLLPKGTEEFMSISFRNPNKLKLIGVPPEFSQAILNLTEGKGTLQGGGPSSGKQNPRVVEMKIRGQIWDCISSKGLFGQPIGRVMLARRFKMDMLKLLENHGWRIYTSSDKSYFAGNDNQRYWVHEANTWHCIRD
jgi:hypothetical protein